MGAPASPFTSREVRWFFDGAASEHPSIVHWFETHAPFTKASVCARPEWQGRLGGKPDVYLLLPGVDDIGIKWREGSLQVKGLVEETGTVRFCDRHEGRVQRWIKWSCAGLPAEIHSIFGPDARYRRNLVPVTKIRALRLFDLDEKEPSEVPPGVMLNHGIALDLTDMVIGDACCFSVAFEAFPDDLARAGQFNDTVECLLDGLSEVSLALDWSVSYPGWLSSRFGEQAMRQSTHNPQAAITGKTIQ